MGGEVGNYDRMKKQQKPSFDNPSKRKLKPQITLATNLQRRMSRFNSNMINQLSVENGKSKVVKHVGSQDIFDSGVDGLESKQMKRKKIRSLFQSAVRHVMKKIRFEKRIQEEMEKKRMKNWEENIDWLDDGDQDIDDRDPQYSPLKAEFYKVKMPKG